MINKSCYFYNYEKNIDYCIIKKKCIADCDTNCKYFGMVSASPLFVHHIDDLCENIQKSKKIEGFDDLAMHSNALYFINVNADGKEIIVTVEEVAILLKQIYKGKVPNLRLISCRAGALNTNDGVAQKLANILNIHVLAARGIVNVYKDGTILVEDPITGEESDDAALWKIFKPNNMGG